jgi:hypothetical protein
MHLAAPLVTSLNLSLSIPQTDETEDSPNEQRKVY